MRIKKLFLQHHISRGTILQKFIDNLKHLAQQQLQRSTSDQAAPLLHKSQAWSQKRNVHTAHGEVQNRKEKMEQQLVEENVNEIILGI